MYTVSTLMKQSNSPYKNPIKLKVMAVGKTPTYQKDGQEKGHTLIGFSDATGSIKGICYDSSKLSNLRLGASVMIRNYIFRDRSLVITSATKITTTSPLTVTTSDAETLILPPPAAPLMSVDAAKKGDVSQLVSLEGKITRVDNVVTRTIARTQQDVSVRTISIKDKTGEVKVSLWRHHSEADVQPGKQAKITNLKMNIYKGDITFNTVSTSTIEVVDEVLLVTVDGFSIDDGKLNLVCVLDGEYEDYKCSAEAEETLLPGGVGDADVLLDMIPFQASITVADTTVITIEVDSL